MSTLGVVELQGAGEGIEDAGGRATEGAALELGVVLHTHSGQGGHLTAAQARNAALPELGHAGLLGVDLARREVRNSRISARLSMSPTLGRPARASDAL